MASWQFTIVLIYAMLGLLVFVKGFYETKYKKNAYGLTRPLLILGIFVWGDAVIFGPFWTIASTLSLLAKNWYLFLFIVSVFWVVRGLGETIYWLNQQFSSKVDINNKPENLIWHSVFHDDSIWYIHQIVWQCITVISVVCAVIISKMWLTANF